MVSKVITPSGGQPWALETNKVIIVLSVIFSVDGTNTPIMFLVIFHHFITKCNKIHKDQNSKGCLLVDTVLSKIHYFS